MDDICQTEIHFEQESQTNNLNQQVYSIEELSNNKNMYLTWTNLNVSLPPKMNLFQKLKFKKKYLISKKTKQLIENGKINFCTALPCKVSYVSRFFSKKLYMP